MVSHHYQHLHANNFKFWFHTYCLYGHHKTIETINVKCLKSSCSCLVTNAHQLRYDISLLLLLLLLCSQTKVASYVANYYSYAWLPHIATYNE